MYYTILFKRAIGESKICKYIFYSKQYENVYSIVQ